ncbi:DNA-directed RNA polymerase III subunit rpc3 [Taphrina deformans PYCC 5710]|uniref:DNA-directed RNA polymerase III subunit RPC3 n=1 Tax=Taphrina deformans (strain PYCC 5710 / ATCC 11124 / CBS 356.35 / IMI 108563 / JCM 9778 / NBRC 8474) TaxID=1097556 RepID=R4X6P4_TAPDE|nr:DNA-directed RNA polymerase III subunit rpc3 [Taphrina deformans PYCC 5710]|eukprot:CCG80566.1 DNA-directed RNA polymerase III subunit rpc3 [Taphrina deformans PYCC 5710]
MASAASRSAAELCRVLLDSFFGPTVAKVAGVLLLYGRLEAVSVSRRGEVSPKLTRQSLAVLIQHNFVRFSTVQEAGHERTFYECDWQQVLYLLQTGRIIWWASKEATPQAAALVKYVSIYGKAKVSDMTNAFTSAGSELRESTKEFHHTLAKLLQTKILQVAQIHESTPVEDFKQSIRDEELRTLNGANMPESKKLVEVEGRLERKLKDLQDKNNAEDAGLKRKAEALDNSRARKRARTTEVEEDAVDPDIMVKVNYQKHAVFQRNEELVKLCQRRLGPTPAAVYGHILKMLEPKIFNCRQNTQDFKISTLSISRALPEDFDLESVWTKDESANGKSKRKKKEVKRRKKRRTNGHRGSDDDSDEDSEEESDDEMDDDASSGADSFLEHDIDDLASDDDDFDENAPAQSGQRIKLVQQFLDLFANDSIGFLRRLSTRSMGEWTVDYPHLANTLRQLEIEALIHQKLGDLAPRLLRIVQAKVKVDEKQLSTTALLKSKDIRHILTALHEMGVLDLQEVPKRLDRQPSMTFFLWHHNQERAVSTLAQDLCKAMARVHQRLKHELQSRRRLLDKSQRTDVRNKESEYLSKQELAELRKIRSVEEKLLAQSSRLASSYSILVEY